MIAIRMAIKSTYSKKCVSSLCWRPSDWWDWVSGGMEQLLLLEYWLLILLYNVMHLMIPFGLEFVKVLVILTRMFTLMIPSLSDIHTIKMLLLKHFPWIDECLLTIRIFLNSLNKRLFKFFWACEIHIYKIFNRKPFIVRLQLAFLAYAYRFIVFWCIFS